MIAASRSCLNRFEGDSSKLIGNVRLLDIFNKRSIAW